MGATAGAVVDAAEVQEALLCQVRAQQLAM